MIRFLALVGLSFLSLIGLVAAGVAWVILSTPRPTDIRSCLVTEMYHVRLCPKDRTYTPISQIPTVVRNAVIVSEDGSFYEHHGIDWFELRASAEKDWDEGRMARGGSTLTQQLAKNIYLDKEKSLLRKLREAMIAVQIEKILSKQEILEKYFNVVEFGPDVYGIRAASQYYFKKSPGQLTATEGAFLAFLLPNPKQYSVSFRKKELTPFARKGIRTIIDRLYRYHKISEEEYQASVGELAAFFSIEAMPDEGADQDLSPDSPTAAAPIPMTSDELPPPIEPPHNKVQPTPVKPDDLVTPDDPGTQTKEDTKSFL